MIALKTKPKVTNAATITQSASWQNRIEYRRAGTAWQINFFRDWYLCSPWARSFSSPAPLFCWRMFRKSSDFIKWRPSCLNQCGRTLTFTKKVRGHFRCLLASITLGTVYQPQFKKVSFEMSILLANLSILGWFLLRFSNSPVSFCKLWEHPTCSQSKCLHIATNAPWYIGDKQFHDDLGAPLPTTSDLWEIRLKVSWCGKTLSNAARQISTLSVDPSLPKQGNRDRQVVPATTKRRPCRHNESCPPGNFRLPLLRFFPCFFFQLLRQVLGTRKDGARPAIFPRKAAKFFRD
jgi:hypothetical protein